MGAERRPPLQPGEAAARPVCPRGRRRVRVARRASRRRRGRPKSPRPARQRRTRAEGAHCRQRPLRLGRRRCAARAARRDRDLRDARSGLLDAQHRDPARAARQLCRPRAPCLDRTPQAAGRHHLVPAADPRAHRREAPRRHGPGQLLGLQHGRFLLPRPQARVGQRHAAQRVPRDGQGPARGRPRGAARRRLQPHRRDRRHRRGDQLPGPGQRELLPASPPPRRRSTRTSPAAATRSTCAVTARCGS